MSIKHTLCDKGRHSVTVEEVRAYMSYYIAITHDYEHRHDPDGVRGRKLAMMFAKAVDLNGHHVDPRDFMVYSSTDVIARIARLYNISTSLMYKGAYFVTVIRDFCHEMDMDLELMSLICIRHIDGYGMLCNDATLLIATTYDHMIPTLVERFNAHPLIQMIR